MTQKHAKRAHEMNLLLDKDPKLKKKLRRWVKRNIANKTTKRKTANNHTHRVMKIPADGRVSVPKSKNLDAPKSKDGTGLFRRLQKVGVIPPGKKHFKVTYTWIVCYVMNIRVDQTKPGWENFECSHICIEHGVGKGKRCVDHRCLVWESKSDNQSRADKSCRKMCHCGCGQNVCTANNTHNPPCH